MDLVLATLIFEAIQGVSLFIFVLYRTRYVTPPQ